MEFAAILQRDGHGAAAKRPLGSPCSKRRHSPLHLGVLHHPYLCGQRTDAESDSRASSTCAGPISPSTNMAANGQAG